MMAQLVEQRIRNAWVAGFPSLGGGFDSRIPLFFLNNQTQH